MDSACKSGKETTIKNNQLSEKKKKTINLFNMILFFINEKTLSQMFLVISKLYL